MLFVIPVLLLCANPQIIDGDTIKCSSAGRIRLVAIDTPDKTTSRVCRLKIGDHVCDDPQAKAATDELIRFTAGRRITYRPVSYDNRNKRIVAQMFAGRFDLQCHQLLAHAARYQPRYDARRIIRKRCPNTVRKALR